MAGRKSKSKKKSKKFFAEQREQSLVKAKIIAKYAASRGAIMTGGGPRKLVYLDLWAGPGRYDDGAESTPLMVLRNAIEDADDLAGTISFKEVFRNHSAGKLYVERNYRDALLALEDAERVKMLPPASERRPYKGKPSLPNDVQITFPRLSGTGSKASRSTPGRPGSGLPPSASARPTA